MCETYEEEQSGSIQGKTEEDPAEIYKVRPPNKKKYEEDMEKILSQIKEKEAEMERLKSLGSLSMTSELQRIKAERSAAIAKRKKIDQELEKLKKIIPDKMRHLVQLESSVIYKSEDKINTAVQRLEWNLKVQPFKLMEEKKIVSEIDRLKRSKKTLVQYMALKQDISGIRDMQRRMREERDMYFQAVGKLNAEEERLRREMISAKTTLSVLKFQIDELHESKRQLVANHKKQMEEFQGAKEKQRKGNWKKREDYKKSVITERRQQLVDLEVEKTPHYRYISWCNSLIKVLSCYNKLSTQDPSPESLSPASSVEEPELADEIGDGQYVLLKKPDDSLENAAGTRRSSKKNRRLRKQSSMKKVTLSPDMVQQLTELGLKAPNSMSEVAEAIESLTLKKILLEQEQQASEVASDAGISATESLICEMSRQVSKTESFEGTVDTNPGDQVYAEILHDCSDEQEEQPEGWEVAGAVGGCEELQILSLNSDSTVEGDAGSVESQSSVYDDSENIRHFVAKCEKVLSADASESEHRQDKLKTYCVPSNQGQISGIKLSSDVACSLPPSDRSMENVDCSISHSDVSVENVDCSISHSDVSVENVDCSISHSDVSVENVDCSISHSDVSVENVDCSLPHSDVSVENVDCSISHSDVSVENVDCSLPHSDVSVENVDCSISHSDVSVENVDCSLPHSDGSMEKIYCSIPSSVGSIENLGLFHVSQEWISGQF
ncbi:unnamed protein product [Candidula unifasciata]|uniref:Uncharacterized protein n=1 Tax=Candidula unifasciata TaxID=100452 RepID=A0A8S4A0J8_9EUPU|nr:unnamed protein product [Candidula unifasciata]